MRRWLDKLSKEVDLCVSPAHLLDLVRWADPARAELAAWFDELDLVWMKSQSIIEQVELATLLLRRAGIEFELEQIPFANGMLAAFEGMQKINNIVAVLRDHRLQTWISHVSPDVVARNDESSRGLYRSLWPDRNFANQNGVSRSQLEAQRRAKTETALSEQARTAAGDLRILSRAANLGIPFKTNVAIDEISLSATPYLALQLEVFRHLAEEIMNAKKRPSQDQLIEHRSDVIDAGHFVGAAYCDIYSCDQAMQRHMRGLREQMGKAHALALRDEGKFQTLVARQLAALQQLRIMPAIIAKPAEPVR